MKKKAIKILCVVMVASCVCVSAYVGKKSSSFVMSDTMLANIEALAGEEENLPECKGPNIYSYTSSEIVMREERVHLSNGNDRLTIYKVRNCIAKGSGSLSGVEGTLGHWVVSSVEVKCLGEDKHTYN